jgi:hypothetical protein
MSNAERQRRFRERNPGYYQRLHARERARVKAASEMLYRERAIARIIAPPMPLCLPAPEQVTQSWGDRLISEIQAAKAAQQTAVLDEAWRRAPAA